MVFWGDVWLLDSTLFRARSSNDLFIRTFPSFNAAAQEAAISRMYGGIHYRTAVEVGIGQGIKVGSLVNDRLNMRK